MSQLGDVLSNLEQLKRVIDKGLRAKPLKMAFFFLNKAMLMPLDHIPHMFRAIRKN